MLYSDIGIVVLACEKAVVGERGWPVTGQVARKSSRVATTQVGLFLSYVARTPGLLLDTDQQSHFPPLKKCIYRS